MTYLLSVSPFMDASGYLTGRRARSRAKENMVFCGEKKYIYIKRGEIWSFNV